MVSCLVAAITDVPLIFYACLENGLFSPFSNVLHLCLTLGFALGTKYTISFQRYFF